MLLAAIQDGLELLTWAQDSFAYADSYDEASRRYRGLRCGQLVNISGQNLSGLLVRPEVAQKQQEAERRPVSKVTPDLPGTTGTGTPSVPIGGTEVPGTVGAPKAAAPKRFHGTVILNPARVGRDAGRIGDEVISHLVGLVGSDVKVILEIEAEIPNGAPENVVRTVTENARTLKFTSHGFEKE